MKRFFGFAFLFFSGVFFLFAEIKLISPIEGNWSNKQMLVIDTSDGADYFYSLNGSDPTVAGFAYDEPVLIDLTGDVTVRISKGFANAETKTISFSVNPEYPSKDSEMAFIYSFIDNGLLNYSSGAEIRIPESMRYSLEQNPESYIKGQTLKYSDYCSLSRFIPCAVTDGNLFWRFIIKTNPKASGTYSRRDLPITIIDWDEISFDDKDLIYRIDNNYWSLPKKNAKIDRSKSHIIYWQSIAYEVGNPIEFFELPPKPELQKNINKDGSVSFSFYGDESYSMCFYEKDMSYHELFTELCVDAFHGEYLSERRKIAVYSDSFYQGTLDVEYELDKRAAPIPEFIVSRDGFHVHGNLSLTIKTPSNAELYVAISEPLVLSGSEDVSSENSPDLSNVTVGDFINKGNSENLVLESAGEKSAFYKIRAYSRLGVVTSEIVEYNVIIDNYNFYFDSSADSLIADGSSEHPFSSFEQGLDFIKDFRSVNLFVSGTLKMPSGKTDIDFNCNISGNENAVLQFPKGSSIVVRNSTMQIVKCRIISDNSDITRNAPSSVIKIENAVLDINDCEFSATGEKNNTVIDASNSAINLKNSVFSVVATSYASFISATSSHVNVASCKIGIVGDTAVAFSVRGSDFALKDSYVRVTGTIGRIAELFGVTAKVSSNNFSADLKKKTGLIDPIYCDKNSILETTGNSVLGF